MEQDNSAARAPAKSRKRPQSRASTTSLHSVTTQPGMDQSNFAGASEMYSGQWLANNHAHAHAHVHAHSKDMGSETQMSPEDMILQAATHMQGSGQEFPVDAPMAASMGHHMPYQQHHEAMPRHPLPAEHYAGNASFTEGDSQMLDRDENEDGDSIAGIAGAPKSSSARSSANNELEMRQLFAGNRHRSLQDVAVELHGNERGPNSERTRQVFAMLWINSVCTKGKGSVPRGRVYANYASRCATERTTVLNPASFGKLVRVLFPGLKTRRLGVRGESKYHYVNFTLVDDQPDAREESVQPLKISPPAEFSKAQQNVHNGATQPDSNAGRGLLPSPQAASLTHSDSPPLRPGSKRHSLYNQPDLAGIDSLHATSTKTPLDLAFSPASEDNFEQSEALALPAIEPYLPQGTDPDAAKSLSALYRSHCTSLVECIRYCREKTFFHLFTSFQGTLTMPVQKLFAKAELAPWIEGCDLVLYQRMMRIVSGLTLQVVPKPVLDTLRNISERLVPHIRESFQGQPQHVIRAKESPATIFAGLLDRALRVNLTAHAAANMLSNPANRDQMYVDWITMIRARKIAECVPTRGMDDVVTVLVTEMRDLLDPVNVPWEVECLTIYGDVVMRNGRQSDVSGGAGTTGQNVLDNWVGFLRSLPEKFPYASHADIVWCVERVGTAVMRDLTLAQGKSFGSWWVTKTWVDEMVCFLAEQGGFMKQKASPSASEATKSQTVVSKVDGRQNSRYSSGSEDFSMSKMGQPQPGRAPFPPANNSKQAPMGDDVHDDSGIGIRTPEDDFPMDKFAFAEPDEAGLIGGAELTAGGDL